MTGLRCALLAGVLTTSALAPVVSIDPAQAQTSARRPNMRAAEAAFYALAPNERTEMHLLLMVTGDFNAMISDRIGGRFYDATMSFQHTHDMAETGVLTPDVVARLRAVGGTIFTSWGMHFVDHPTAAATLSVPGTFGLVETQTARGLAFENKSQTFSVAFAAYPTGDAPMAEVFDNLSTPTPNRRIDMKVFRPDFFAVAGGGDRYGTYSRYIATPEGAVGFTVTWNTDFFPNGNRVAVVMANGLFPHRFVPSESPPIAQAPVPTPPPQTAALEPPQPPQAKTVIVTGSGFYVSTNGDLITNNHVIRGCDDAVVVKRGTARIVARDVRNDLALLHLVTRPDPGTTRPVAFRSTPMQLGETAYVLGYPYAGTLDNGVNFTSGMISSSAGMSNDATQFQFTAPVQPGSSGGPVLDQGGNLIGVVVARMNDVASLEKNGSVPQNVNFGIKGEVAASFLRANGVTPAMAADAPAEPATQVATTGSASTAQIVCSRPPD